MLLIITLQSQHLSRTENYRSHLSPFLIMAFVQTTFVITYHGNNNMCLEDTAPCLYSLNTVTASCLYSHCIMSLVTASCL